MDGDDWFDEPMNESFNDGPTWRGGGRGGRGNFRNDRYSNAYGDYNGGYGPSGAPGPHSGFGPNSGPYRPPGPLGPPCPPGSFGPYYMWGRGFGPGGPPIRKPFLEEKTFRYLRPRMHYLSKNHAKNQKKWFSKQSDGGQRTKEIPIKSRELYCELCDVHITSKTHADSHYAGKPHRSIVEGRKNPKNLTLLQKGMGDRLDQLIRREKKFMKSLDDSQGNEEAVDSKQIPPEFYCDICKTSVTCSEQMTMHLNGKRHLSKEKSHILKMMKGEAVSSTGNNVTEEADEEDEEEEPEAEEAETAEAETGEDKYDWGNGSGNWEESTTD